MKNLSKLAIGAALALLVAVSIQPVQAACSAPYLIESASIDGNSAVVSNPDWCFPAYGCYDYEGGAPISPKGAASARFKFAG